MLIPLIDTDAAKLRAANTLLVERPDQTAIYAPALRPGEKIYAMINRCGLLRFDEPTGKWECTDYANRPFACADFERGLPKLCRGTNAGWLYLSGGFREKRRASSG
jgi:hypothetical protein